jgi:hypothetical protein
MPTNHSSKRTSLCFLFPILNSFVSGDKTGDTPRVVSDGSLTTQANCPLVLGFFTATFLFASIQVHANATNFKELYLKEVKMLEEFLASSGVFFPNLINPIPFFIRSTLKLGRSAQGRRQEIGSDTISLFKTNVQPVPAPCSTHKLAINKTIEGAKSHQDKLFKRGYQDM